MSRLFLALTPPDDLRKALAGLCPRHIAGIRPVRRDLIHLTVHFLGEADEEEVTAVLESLPLPAPLDLKIRGVGRFSSRNRKTLLWAGVEESETLDSWHNATADALAGAGFAIRRGDWHPHLTLARVAVPRREEKATQREAVVTFLKERADFRLPVWTVSGLDLYRSETIGGTLQYSLVRRFPADKENTEVDPEAP